MVSFKVEGLDALQAQLLEVAGELAPKMLAAAMRKAFAPVIARAKELVPKDSGALADALSLKTVKGSDSDLVVAVGMYVSKGKGEKQAMRLAHALGVHVELPPSRRWHFIELGTVKLAAHPFARPALDASASQVLELLKAELAKGIERAIKRQARAAAKAAA